MESERCGDEHGIWLGVDFGVSSTVIAVREAGSSDVRLPDLNGISRNYTGRGRKIPVVPSRIGYTPGGDVLPGEMAPGSCDPAVTVAERIRFYVERNTGAILAGGDGSIRYRNAALDFLGTLIRQAVGEAQIAGIAVTAPVGFSGHYTSMVRDVAFSCGIRQFAPIDEISAAIIGNGIQDPGDEVFLFIGLFQDSLEAGFYLSGDRDGTGSHEPGVLQSRELGKAEYFLGTSKIRQWIGRDLAARPGLGRSQPEKGLSQDVSEAADRFFLEYPAHGARPHDGKYSSDDCGIGMSLNDADLDRILRQNNLFGILGQVIGQALASSDSLGYRAEDITSVLMAGEGGMLAPVQEYIRDRFGRCRIYADHPLDAAARGAASWRPGSWLEHRVRSGCSLRYWDAGAREHRYRPVVHAGTRYPSAGQVSRITVSAAYDLQKYLGLSFHEFAGSASIFQDTGAELVADPDGGARIVAPPAGESTALDACRVAVHSNGRPFLLAADPPARKGESRFVLTFTLDEEKWLCVTARDIATGEQVMSGERIHQLR